MKNTPTRMGASISIKRCGKHFSDKKEKRKRRRFIANYGFIERYLNLKNKWMFLFLRKKSVSILFDGLFIRQLEKSRQVYNM